MFCDVHCHVLLDFYTHPIGSDPWCYPYCHRSCCFISVSVPITTPAPTPPSAVPTPVSLSPQVAPLLSALSSTALLWPHVPVASSTPSPLSFNKIKRGFRGAGILEHELKILTHRCVFKPPPTLFYYACLMLQATPRRYRSNPLQGCLFAMFTTYPAGKGGTT